MSGHLLQNINPAAAARMGGKALDEASLPPLPGEGQMVMFQPRPGERRSGRTRYPAMVMGHNPDGTLDLMIFRDVDDLIRLERCRESTDADPFNAWSWPDQATKVEPFEPSRLNALTRDLAELKAKVFGEFADPPRAIMEFMDEFGRRLKRIEKALKLGPIGK